MSRMYRAREFPVTWPEISGLMSPKRRARAARRMIDFCGLEWDPACLAFHESKRTVRTASLSQVRQPVYKKSVQRWKNYEDALKPLFTIIDS